MSRGDGSASYTATSTATLSSTAAGANADVTTALTIPAPDYNFSNVTNGTPSAAFIAPGPGNPGFVAATHPALGDVIGTLSSLTNLGLTNLTCSSGVTVDFTFLNATVNTADTISPVPQTFTNSGSGGTLDNQWSDNGSSTTGPGADPPWNAAWPGMDAGESANGLPAQVDEFPSYLTTIFTPDGGSVVQPLARYAGATPVAGSTIILNLVIFAPDALANAFPAPHPFNDLRGVGYTSIAVLNNPITEAAPSSITDFCTSLSTTATLQGTARANPCNGITAPPCDTQILISAPTPGGPTKVRYANPAVAGTYLWVSFHQSLRDSDGDGIENALDTCPTSALDGLNPRTGVGPDGDGDGIADICDAFVSGGDQDTDGWQNRGDNCPTVSNATNAESENPPTTYLTAARRGGPRTDSMGDACDTAPNAPTVANGIFETTLTVDANCIGGVDGDGDGWCAAAGGAPSIPIADPNDAAGAVSPEDYDLVFPMAIAHSGSGAAPPMRQPVQVCNDGIDNDGDTLIDNNDSGGATNTACRPRSLATTDTDGDGYNDEAERAIGTDALGRCEAGGPTPSTDWPADLVSSGASADKINLTDITSFVAPAPKKLNSGPNGFGAPNVFVARWDLVPGNSAADGRWIVLNDLTSITAGGTANPPMYVGIGNGKIFNNVVCTAHPTLGD